MDDGDSIHNTETSGTGGVVMRREPLLKYSLDILARMRKTLEERGASYADYRDNAAIHMTLMAAMGQGYEVGDSSLPDWVVGATSQITSKLSRVAMPGGHAHGDNWLDIAGYAILALACLERDQKEKAPISAPISSMPPPKTPHGQPVGVSEKGVDMAITGHGWSWARDQMENGGARGKGVQVTRTPWRTRGYLGMYSDKESMRYVIRGNGYNSNYIPTEEDYRATDWVLA